MTSASPTHFFVLGILWSLSSCIGPVLHSPRSVSLRDSMSNGSFWHVIPMFSGGSTYVSTSPVWRFSLKFDVLKNLLSVGLLNSILPSVVPSWSLFSIGSPTLVLQRSGTYQSRLMVPCCRTNSLIVFLGSMQFYRRSCGLVRCLLHLLWVCFVVYPLCHGSFLDSYIVLC